MPTSFLRRKTSAGLLAALVAVLSVLPGDFTAVKNQNQLLNQAQAATYSLAALKGIDVMKFTKDTMTNQPTDAEIESLIGALKAVNATHVSISIPMDPDSDYPGNKPAPRSSVQLAQKWADTIHANGFKIIWRGTFAGIEGIYGFPKKVGSNRFPTGTAGSAAADGSSTWLGKTYQYIVNNPNFFATGDIWAPLPERTEGIFQDATSFISYSGAGLQANYTTFFNDLKTVSDQAFARIGKSVTTGMTANNYSEVISTWLPQALFDHNGIIAIDYYGNNHSAQEMESDIRKMAQMRGKPVFLQEWGDYWNANMPQAERTAYLNSIYAVLQRLADEGILAGFNYWGGWDNNAEGILTRTSSGFQLNYRGQLLAKFFGQNSVTGPVTNPGTPPTNPPTASSCPPAASNAFTGCYFSDANMGSLLLSRQDAAINFDWGSNSPDAKVPQDKFWARWQGNFSFNSGDYAFTITGDDGIRLYIDNQLVIDGWKDQPATTYTATRAMSSGSHLVKVEYYENGGGAVAKAGWTQKTATTPPATQPTPPPASSCPPAASNAFTGCYFKDRTLTALGTVRTDSALNFDWGSNSPDPAIPSDNFSARWEGSFNFNAGDHAFTALADDGVRVYLDNQLVIDGWKDQGPTTYTASRSLTAGVHLVRMEYYERGGGAVAKLSWKQNQAAGNAFTATYFSDMNLGNRVLSRTENSINYAWNDGSPAAGVPTDKFSARWEGSFDFIGGNRTFTVTADDGVRLYVDDKLLIDQWKDQASSTYTATVNLAAGAHLVKMEYYEAFGGAVARLSWK